MTFPSSSLSKNALESRECGGLAMNRKKTDPPLDSSKLTGEVETLYASLIDAFYDRGDRERAREIATELQHTLNNRPDVADSIRGEEIRSTSLN